jgi:cyclopropane-fatty-acyl-phospholipid synthase
MRSTSPFERKAQSLLKNTEITINGSKPWDIQVRDSSMFRDTILKGSLGFGDAYTAGKWDVKSIDQFFVKLFEGKANYVPSLVDAAQLIRNALINTQAGRRAFQVGQRHYDLGNEMYELMLGESMGYSCGIYLKKTDTLADAQYNKFDALCQKLQLKPGMKVLEIGAGWGTFARHAAKNYGVEVIGLTVSKEQKKFAEERCNDLNVKFLLLDYQKMSSTYNGHFDRVVSIEMIEAVGKKNFKMYFKTIERVLKDDGLFGLQAILGSGKADAFTSTRIFPNGLVPSMKQIVSASSGLLRVKYFESIGKDYDKTLMDWEENFRKNWHKISELKDASGKKLYDEAFYRMWRYYLLCCAATFRVGYNDDAHIVFSKLNSASPLK